MNRIIWPGRAKSSPGFAYWMLLVLISMVGASCAAPATMMKENSLQKRPDWINSPISSPSVLYFVGIKTFAPTLEEGQNAAFKDAVSKIADYIGVSIESVYRETVTEADQRISQSLSSRSSALIEQASLVDSYYEKTTRIDRNFRIEKYDFFVLVSVSRELLEKEKKRKAEEFEKKILSAVEYYNRGMESERQDRDYDARYFYTKALGVLPKDSDVNAYTSKDGREWDFIIGRRLEEVNARLSQVVFELTVAGPTEARNVFEANFISELNKSGFTVNDRKPSLILRGEMSVRESSYVMNNYVYYAEGNISVIRSSDKVTIAVFPFKSRGFHRHRSEALVEAAREAGKEAGSGITKSLAEKNDPEKK